jgi:cytochrome c oxidase assembly factor CtaG
MHIFNLSALYLIEGEALPMLPAALFHTWSWPVLPLVSLVLGTGIYLRGWAVARKTRPSELPLWRAACFLGGAASLWSAIASPIDALDDYLLAAHMIQHFILMSVAPPLLVLSAPLVPLLRGLPRWIIRKPLQWFFRSPAVEHLLHFLSHPAAIWLAMNITFLGWHAPKAFELTFRSEGWHNLEHLSFFFTSVAFWFVVLQPWPTASRWPRWAAIPYLLSADAINTVLSALLTFSGRVLYPTYEQAPRVCSLTPMQDQIAAGSEMWLLNSTVFLIPAIVLTARFISPKIYRQKPAELNI